MAWGLHWLLVFLLPFAHRSPRCEAADTQIPRLVIVASTATGAEAGALAATADLDGVTTAGFFGEVDAKEEHARAYGLEPKKTQEEASKANAELAHFAVEFRTDLYVQSSLAERTVNLVCFGYWECLNTAQPEGVARGPLHVPLAKMRANSAMPRPPQFVQHPFAAYFRPGRSYPSLPPTTLTKAKPLDVESVSFSSQDKAQKPGVAFRLGSSKDYDVTKLSPTSSFFKVSVEIVLNDAPLTWLWDTFPKQLDPDHFLYLTMEGEEQDEEAEVADNADFDFHKVGSSIEVDTGNHIRFVKLQVVARNDATKTYEYRTDSADGSMRTVFFTLEYKELPEDVGGHNRTMLTWTAHLKPNEDAASKRYAYEVLDLHGENMLQNAEELKTWIDVAYQSSPKWGGVTHVVEPGCHFVPGYGHPAWWMAKPSRQSAAGLLATAICADLAKFKEEEYRILVAGSFESTAEFGVEMSTRNVMVAALEKVQGGCVDLPAAPEDEVEQPSDSKGPLIAASIAAAAVLVAVGIAVVVLLTRKRQKRSPPLMQQDRGGSTELASERFRANPRHTL